MLVHITFHVKNPPKDGKDGKNDKNGKEHNDVIANSAANGPDATARTAGPGGGADQAADVVDNQEGGATAGANGPDGGADQAKAASGDQEGKNIDKLKEHWLYMVNWHICLMATIELMPLAIFSLAIIIYMREEDLKPSFL